MATLKISDLSAGVGSTMAMKQRDIRLGVSTTQADKSVLYLTIASFPRAL